MDPQSRPKHIPELELRATGSDVLVHDTLAKKVHVLNSTAGRILTLCDGDHDVEAIVDSIVREWSVEPSTARVDVETLLGDFARLGLLIGSD